jgi:aspartate/methionine/tyrosine aminotransferase
MISAPRYLEWALRFYGQVPYDLATSGIPQVPLADLAPLPDIEDPSGPAKLVAAIARYNGVSRDEVVPALGTTHALWLAYATLLRPGDEVLVEAPSYEPIWLSARATGARVLFFEREEADRYRLDPARVAAKMTEATRIVAVSNLHNPTGVRASDEDLREVARLAKERGAYLLVDEVYAPFDALVGADGVWHGSARKLGSNVVVASSLTKCFGLGAERIGWVLAPEELAEAARGAILATMGHLPREHANLGVHAFARLPELSQRARALLGDKRARVQTWAESRSDLSWSAPECGLFGFASGKANVDVTTVEEAAHAEGIIVAPGAFFGAPGGFRLAWSIDGSKLDEGLKRLGHMLGGQVGRRANAGHSL